MKAKAQMYAAALAVGLGLLYLVGANGVHAPGGQIAPGQDVQLSPNYRLSDMVASSTARARGIDNMPSAAVIRNLRRVANEILEPLRRYFGWASVSSGFRIEELNAAVGGAAHSHHMDGTAIDVNIPGYIKALPKSVKLGWLRNIASKNIQFGKAIAYGDTGHIHFSLGTGKQLYWTEKKGGPAIRI